MGADPGDDARALVPGDIIKIKIGDVVPADLKLVEGDYIQADQSALTGESLPVQKKAGDISYSNSVIKQGEMKAVVVNTASNTFFGKTVALVARARREERSHFQKAVIGIGNYLIVITIFLAAFILITAMFRQENMISILRFTLVLTVAAIPVALPAVLSVTMAVGAMNLAKKQAIVSRLVAIEELAGVDVLCSDKTGTLTQNRMTVSDPVSYGTYSTNDVMIYAGLASRQENMDPIELPVFEYLEAKGMMDSLIGFTRVKFIPFDPVSKRTEAQVIAGDKKTLIVTKGAPQVILDLCGGGCEGIEDKVGELAEKGFRTLGVGVKHPGDEHFQYAGLIPLFDPPREDSSETIREARALGLDVKMVTGDNRAIARQIAGILGIGEDILDATELKGASTREMVVLGELITRTLYKKLSPSVSEHDIRRFSKDVIGGRFAVSKDVSLKKADAGIAVSGATDAADVVLMAPGLSVIVDAIKGARVTFERMKSYSIYRRRL